MLILHFEMDYLNEHIVQSQIESRVVLWVLAFLLHTCLFLSFMFYKFEIRFWKIAKTFLPFIFWLVRKPISRTYTYLEIVYGSGLLVFKQSGFRTMLKKESSLDMSLVPHKMSYDMMLNHKDTNLQSIVFLMKDSMMFPQNLSASTPRICFVYPTVSILRRPKVLLMYLVTWNFMYIIFLGRTNYCFALFAHR